MVSVGVIFRLFLHDSSYSTGLFLINMPASQPITDSQQFFCIDKFDGQVHINALILRFFLLLFLGGGGWKLYFWTVVDTMVAGLYKVFSTYIICAIKELLVTCTNCDIAILLAY